MPTYAYHCNKCRKKFTLVMRISDHDRKRVHCPKCGSAQVAHDMQTFFANTSKKS